MLYSPWNSNFLSMEKTKIKGWRVGRGKVTFPQIPVSVCGACCRAGWESGENWGFFGFCFTSMTFEAWGGDLFELDSCTQKEIPGANI